MVIGTTPLDIFPFLEKERSGHGHRHHSSSRPGHEVAMSLHNLPLRSSPSSSGKGKGWSWPHNRLFRSHAPHLGKGRDGHDHKPPHFYGERKGFEEKREASQRYHMEAQLKSLYLEHFTSSLFWKRVSSANKPPQLQHSTSSQPCFSSATVTAQHQLSA